jgi:hypothetical protein
MNPELNLGALACAPGTKDDGKREGQLDGARAAAARPEIVRGGARPAADASKAPRRRKAANENELPPPGVTRWVIRRKAQVVAAVQAGTISLEEVCRRYSVSVEEFQGWESSLRRHGLYGLRTTRTQIYRSSKSDSD